MTVTAKELKVRTSEVLKRVQRLGSATITVRGKPVARLTALTPRKAMPLAEDQIIVAGVIDSLTNFVEHPEVVADRIERVAATIGDPRRVLAGTDCGFETAAGMGRVAEDVVWAKLRALTEGARIASQRLFAT